MQETASVLKRVLHGLKMERTNRIETNKSLVKSGPLQTWEEPVWPVPKKVLQINLDKMLRISMSALSRDLVSETGVVEMLRKNLSKIRVYKLANFIRAHENETFD